MNDHTSTADTIYPVSKDRGLKPDGAQQRTTGVPTGGRVQSLNPATGEVWQEYDSISVEQVQALVARARVAQKEWGALAFEQRAVYLRKLADLVLARQMEIAQLVTRENGKPIFEALVTEIMPTLDFIHYYRKHGPVLLRPKRVPHANWALKTKRGKIVHEPLGVVGIISPWNYPFMLPLGTIAPALVAGNTVVLKPSEFTPSSALKIAELFKEVGLPENVFAVAIGDGAAGAALAQCQLDRIVFTGSVATGRKVALSATERLIPVTLELGGSDAMIVLRDANLDYATSGALWGRFMNCGQSCVAAKRIFVEREVFELFVEKLVHKVQQLRLGKGEDPTTDVGPLIRPRQVDAIEAQLRGAVASGARVLCGGKRRMDLGPCFFEPTVLVEVTPKMNVMCEETFGPLLPIVAVKDAEEALHYANDTDFGLSASIWTSDIKRGRALASRLEVGAVLINDVIAHVGTSEASYGGIKSSGLGRTHGPEGLLDMMRTKFVDVDTVTFLRKPWWFRYNAKMRNNISSFSQFMHGRSLWTKVKNIPGTLRLLNQRGKV
ncbi:aldehyde dehydrogenase family protein [candidate division KSB1 bacterium]|nr:aldehyde dehydrogenase family protein [candidate division KSB1 bacterium]